ncbi:Ferroporti-1 [Papiliotrema laurentii]|uniref:Solute carrier family 40 member n=1 Tax=Papiliotrema laurentii TaxID=5418 RepID=A0AAD9FRE2_PAPLA|nr:Ferroporti-1 [Papiliotrema laurentii]
MLGPLSSTASAAFRFKASTRDNLLTWSILMLTILFSSVISLCQTGMQVAVERDWILAIAQEDPTVLSKLNSLVVSVLTFALGYIRGGSVLILLTALSMVGEFWWIRIVYRHFPVLRVDDVRTQSRKKGAGEEEQPLLARTEIAKTGRWERTCKFFKEEASAWGEFIRLPIFWDGIGVSYFKLARGWEDGYLSLFRAGCLITSLIGTASEPYLERRWGSRRIGMLSLCFAAATLGPAVAMFFLSSGRDGSLPIWTTAVMVTGIIVTRAGSTSFQFAEIKQLQLSLADHPQRNRLTALQSALGHLFQLLRFAMTLVWSTVDTFKWTTAVTLGSHATAILLYACYISLGKHASAA